jgi:hypothetical protein
VTTVGARVGIVVRRWSDLTADWLVGTKAGRRSRASRSARRSVRCAWCWQPGARPARRPRLLIAAIVATHAGPSAGRSLPYSTGGCSGSGCSPSRRRGAALRRSAVGALAYMTGVTAARTREAHRAGLARVELQQPCAARSAHRAGQPGARPRRSRRPSTAARAPPPSPCSSSTRQLQGRHDSLGHGVGDELLDAGRRPLVLVCCVRLGHSAARVAATSSSCAFCEDLDDEG